MAFKTVMSALLLTAVAFGAWHNDAQAKPGGDAQWGLTFLPSANGENASSITSRPVKAPVATSGSQTEKKAVVVKIIDLPDMADFQREDGTYVDLGWSFIGETDGKWVGYIGSDIDYLTISPEQLVAIMAAAKLTALPEPPKRVSPKTLMTAGNSSPPDVGWTMLLIVGAMALYVRYLIQKVVWNAASQFGDIVKQAADAFSQLTTTKAAPAATAGSTVQPARHVARVAHMAPARRTTVVRSSPSLFSRT